MRSALSSLTARRGYALVPPKITGSKISAKAELLSFFHTQILLAHRRPELVTNSEHRAKRTLSWLRDPGGLRHCTKSGEWLVDGLHSIDSEGDKVVHFLFDATPERSRKILVL